MRRSARTVCVAAVVWRLAIGTAQAQAGDPSLEFWPEIDTWWRVSPAWRVSLFVPVSRNVETDYREGNFIPQVDFAWGKPNRLHTTRLLDENRAMAMKAMMVRTGYLHGSSLGDDGEDYSEQTVFAEFHVRTPLKRGLLVSHRLRTDVRWLGQDSDLSNRWRYRLMVEKELAKGRTSVVPYVNGEAYYDSRYETVNRIRWINGATVAWTPRYAIEGNVTYQHDTRSSVTNLLALNVIVHLYFETRRAAPPPVAVRGRSEITRSGPQEQMTTAPSRSVHRAGQ